MYVLRGGVVSINAVCTTTNNKQPTCHTPVRRPQDIKETPEAKKIQPQTVHKDRAVEVTGNGTLESKKAALCGILLRELR